MLSSPYRLLPALGLALGLAACTPAEPEPAPKKAAPAPSTPAQTEVRVSQQANPFFHGIAEHWALTLHRALDGSYPVELSWGMGSAQAQGVLQRTPSDEGAPASLSVYSGPVSMPDGRTLEAVVEISLGSCTDDADQLHTHRVQVTLAGEEQLTGGCGDLL